MERDSDFGWRDLDFGHIQCLFCARVMKRPHPHLHSARRWAVGFNASSARKGLAAAQRSRHRRVCIPTQAGPLLPDRGKPPFELNKRWRKP